MQWLPIDNPDRRQRRRRGSIRWDETDRRFKVIASRSELYDDLRREGWECRERYSEGRKVLGAHDKPACSTAQLRLEEHCNRARHICRSSERSRRQMNLAGGNHNTVMSDDVLAGGARESHVRSRLSAYRLAGSDQPRTTLPVRRVVRRVAEPTAGTTTPSRPPGVSAAGCRLAVPFLRSRSSRRRGRSRRRRNTRSRSGHVATSLRCSL